MTSEKQIIDYDNLAFNPYAISTGDLAIDDDNRIKSGKPMENHGYLPSEAVVENNPHYEDTLEVAKKAGLTGTGRRRKENIVYEDCTITKKNIKDKSQPKPHRASNLPPRPTEDWQRDRSNKTKKWMMPFAILCFLVLLCLVGGALGVLSYFEKKKCSCDSLAAQTGKVTGSTKPGSLENLTETVQQLLQKLKELETKLGEVEKEQQEQKAEQKTKLNYMTKLNGQLSSRVNDINSTFAIKFNSVKSNVSNLAKHIDEFNNTLWNTRMFSWQLFNTIDNINSTFTIKLRNISKQVGPRGFNGSQGSSGIGNLSLCVVQTKSNTQAISTSTPKLTKANVEVVEQPGWKIMAADCSTKERAGAAQTVLTVTEKTPPKYVCTCAGTSEYGPFQPKNNKEIECVITYWQCPLLT